MSFQWRGHVTKRVHDPDVKKTLVTMTRQHKFIVCHKCTGFGDDDGGEARRSATGSSAPSSHFCCEPKTPQKIKKQKPKEVSWACLLTTVPRVPWRPTLVTGVVRAWYGLWAAGPPPGAGVSEAKPSYGGGSPSSTSACWETALRAAGHGNGPSDASSPTKTPAPDHALWPVPP